MPIENLIAFTGALALAAAIPGPGMLGLIGWTLGRGTSAAFGYVLGLLCGDLIYLCLAAAGLAALAETMGEAFLVIKLAGGAYLIWMGVKLWRSHPTGDIVADEKGISRSALVAGLTTTLANPKTIIFYMGIMPMVVDMHAMTPGVLAELAGLAVIVLSLVCLPYAVAAHRARRLMRSPRALARLNKGAGVALIGVGATVAAS
ncbi:threonine transporter RhtB [Rhodospirillum rubrum]|uniref:LysE family translocator n=1 Tax=Rhodospirillum rubrum TaxID=1085 RepID=UPI001903EF29|nr:LysE family translocator [Rhodospirillum rubrum]MBK1665930.1 threonine transporter RhtB [Rhodospirillum rubrum]MBK1678068.1 threonine transporter RhtB [Rhodospirillum rubrum]